MSTSSKFNPLTIIIITAILLFIAAIIWKTTHSDNSEEIFVPKISNVKKVKIKKQDLTENTISDYDSRDNDLKIREEYENKMYKIKMLTTPERTVKAIEYYKSINDEKRVNEYIDWLLEKFPEYNYEN